MKIDLFFIVSFNHEYIEEILSTCPDAVDFFFDNELWSMEMRHNDRYFNVFEFKNDYIDIKFRDFEFFRNYLIDKNYVLDGRYNLEIFDRFYKLRIFDGLDGDIDEEKRHLDRVGL